MLGTQNAAQLTAVWHERTTCGDTDNHCRNLPQNAMEDVNHEEGRAGGSTYKKRNGMVPMAMTIVQVKYMKQATEPLLVQSSHSNELELTKEIYQTINEEELP